MIISVKLTDAIKPYVRQKIEREIIGFRIKAEERLRLVFDKLADDYTKEVLKIVANKVNKKMEKK